MGLLGPTSLNGLETGLVLKTVSKTFFLSQKVWIYSCFKFVQVVLSVLLTAAGCVIAALGDFSFDLFGYGLALTSVFFRGLFTSLAFNLYAITNIAFYSSLLALQTMYLLLVEKSGAQDGLSSIEIMFYNSFLSLPFLSFLIIATGEFPNSVLLLLAKVRDTFMTPSFRLFSVSSKVFNYFILLDSVLTCRSWWLSFFHWLWGLYSTSQCFFAPLWTLH